MPTYKRSIAKKIGKENEVARLYFKEHEKPRDIAKQVILSVQQVYAIVASLRQSAKRLMNKVDPSDVPADVKLLNLSNQERLVEVLNLADDKARNKRREIKYDKKNIKRNNPLLLSEMDNFFELKGIYNNTVQDLRNYLLGKLPEDKVPSTKIIRQIMKEDFNLKFKKFDKANTKYIDSAYN